MLMPITQSITVLATDDKIWFDAETLLTYLRDIEEQAQFHLSRARQQSSYSDAVAAHAAKELVRQIADGLVLTTMTAGERLRGRRESGG